MSSTHLFGVEVALPPGWEEETVYLMAGPQTVKGRARPTMTAARTRAATLEDAVARLGPGAADGGQVLVDELREEQGLRFYERVARFADAATGAPVQQGTRVYHAGDTALVVALTTPAIEFNAAYGGFAQVAASVAGALPGAAAVETG